MCVTQVRQTQALNMRSGFEIQIFFICVLGQALVLEGTPYLFMPIDFLSNLVLPSALDSAPFKNELRWRGALHRQQCVSPWS